MVPLIPFGLLPFVVVTARAIEQEWFRAGLVECAHYFLLCQGVAASQQ